jgi:hypothetical protein
MRLRIRTTLSVVFVMGGFVLAQSPTLRERVESQGGNIELHINVDGEVASVSQMLAETNVVVHGIIGQGVARLSSDERSITTTYELIQPRIAFSSSAVPVDRPGVTPQTIALTEPGGTVAIGRFSATITYDDSPRLIPGMEIVGFLTNRGGRYFAARRAGVFAVTQGHVQMLARHSGEQQRFAGMRVEDFIAEMVAQRKQMK